MLAASRRVWVGAVLAVSVASFAGAPNIEPCPVGKTRSEISGGRYKGNLCIPCAPGLYSLGGDNQANGRGPLGYSGLCKACPIGKFSTVGAEACFAPGAVSGTSSTGSTSAPAAPAYTRVGPGVCSVGHMVDASGTDTSLNDCQTRCDNAADCKSVAYCPACTGSGRKNRCVLFSTLCTSPNAAANQYEFDKYEVYSKDKALAMVNKPNSGYTFVGNGVCKGDDVMSESGFETSLTKCQKRCDDASGCKTLAYCAECTDGRTNKCVLYKDTCGLPNSDRNQYEFWKYAVYYKERDYTYLGSGVCTGPGVMVDESGTEPKLSRCYDRCDKLPACKALAYCHGCSDGREHRCVLYSTTCDSIDGTENQYQFDHYDAYRKKSTAAAPALARAPVDDLWNRVFGL